ncbi:DUF3558 family protein [Nocardia sp. NPDC004068]|uniref:DUF3558 family protein n=1 Tax=Nocardia sp. NPDC004068 TaxID=3364303 RepID=UPI0036863748
MNSIALLGISALALAACGTSNPHATAHPTPAPPPPSIRLAECAGMTAADVGAAAGLGAVTAVASNPLTCRWEHDPPDAVTFKWLRGSPIDAYRTDPGQSPRAPLDVRGHRGYRWQQAHSCEVAAELGAGEFLTWTIESDPDATTDPCAGATALAAATLDKS